jgi:hypothetical protein
MAVVDLDALLARLRGLSTDELARVKALVDELEPGESRMPAGRFRAFSGVLSEEDARAMARAAEDCEQIDPRGW